jgi:hypothetical protein
MATMTAIAAIEMYRRGLRLDAGLAGAVWATSAILPRR